MYNAVIDDDAADFLADVSDGDARRALSAVELGILTTEPSEDQKIHITLEIAQECIQRRAPRYDKGGDNHYDTISAFIKSMRGSDPDAAVYYLARMLEAGEDPKFIARRIMICASEDVGNADPQAICVAVSCSLACERIGLPEAQIILAQAASYVASAPKSNASYKAINEALSDVRNNRVQPIPFALRDPHSAGGKANEHGKDYIYPHETGGFAVQDYMQVPKKYYKVAGAGYESKIKERLDYFDQLRQAAKAGAK
jgi:putative ATPase